VVKVDQRQASNDEHDKELVGKKIIIDLRVNVINCPLRLARMRRERD
jgi:hypothetical protein